LFSNFRLVLFASLILHTGIVHAVVLETSLVFIITVFLVAILFKLLRYIFGYPGTLCFKNSQLVRILLVITLRFAVVE
jgi:hypothetical protein